MVHNNESTHYFMTLMKILCSLRGSLVQGRSQPAISMIIFLLFTFVTIPPKHKSSPSAGDAWKKRKVITTENKVEIIKSSDKQAIAGIENSRTERVSWSLLFQWSRNGKVMRGNANTERLTKIYRTVTKGLKCCKAMYDEKKKISGCLLQDKGKIYALN